MSIKNDEKYFIRNVKNYMVENKLSNGKMAKRMGVSTSNVSNILNGSFDITMGFIKKASNTTGMTIAQLFSPDPKQYGSAVEGDVQDSNAVAMMELMKKQMEELKRENERLSDENDSRLEDVKDMEKHIAELQFENAAIRTSNDGFKKEIDEREEVEVSLRKQITELKEIGEHLARRANQLEEENEGLAQENSKMYEKLYHTKAEPVYMDNVMKATLDINADDKNGEMYINGRFFSDVFDVKDIDPFKKLASVLIYFDKINIK